MAPMFVQVVQTMVSGAAYKHWCQEAWAKSKKPRFPGARAKATRRNLRGTRGHCRLVRCLRTDEPGQSWLLLSRLYL